MAEPRFANIVIPPLHQRLTYGFGPFRPNDVKIGHQVRVPLGRRTATGFVVEKIDEPAEGSDFQVRQILDIVGSERSFDPAQLPFFSWIAKYYGDSLANVIDAAVPPRVSSRVTRVIALGPTPPDQAKGPLQRAILEAVMEEGGSLPHEVLSQRVRRASTALGRMEERGLIVIERQPSLDTPIFSNNVPDWAPPEIALNKDQETCVQAIQAAADSSTFKPFLLHGVTGSGKTEVYIEAIRHVREAGKGALVIVPEIALTPQLVDRFRARLGDNIALLHSGLHKRLRWESWCALLEGRINVAIGARSGIFAPVRNLGLIVVDEEHDSSYKQQDGLRYNARDVALRRGQMENCPVVLGSATPSLETYHKALSGKYPYLSLASRHIGASSLTMKAVDLNSKKPWEMASRNVSSELHAELAAAIERGEQSFILYNRRGFSNYLQCDSCEYVVECPHCSVTLTFHKQVNLAICHYCNHSKRPAQHCPKCEAKGGESNSATPPGNIVFRGAGTEKIFDELRELFPEVPMERLDRDAASDEAQYRAILDRMRSGETKVLVGTQMIAKGHDLPDVTLVGVVDCDVGLHMPDFRAGERVFQLLTQAGGRAGRANKPGKVILQTRVPKHFSIVRTILQDYTGFAKEELELRRTLRYPPFGRLIRVIAAAQDPELPPQLLNHLKEVIYEYLRETGLNVEVLGPAPAPLERIKTHWRWHILLKSPSASSLHSVLKRLKQEKKQSQKIRLLFDVDPQDMM